MKTFLPKLVVVVLLQSVARFPSEYELALHDLMAIHLR